MSRPEVVYLIGTGAVTGSWDPVIRATQVAYANVRTRDQANTVLANLVLELRTWNQIADLAGRNDSEVAPADLALLAKLRDNYNRKRLLVCQSIANEIQHAQERGEIRVQNEFDAVWNRFLETD